jgi:hypothetical protein
VGRLEVVDAAIGALTYFFARWFKGEGKKPETLLRYVPFRSVLISDG